METHAEGKDNAGGRVEETKTKYIVEKKFAKRKEYNLKKIGFGLAIKQFLGTNGAIEIYFFKEFGQRGVGMMLNWTSRGGDWLGGLPDFMNLADEFAMVFVKEAGKSELTGFTVKKLVVEEKFKTGKRIVVVLETEVVDKSDKLRGGFFVGIEPEDPVVGGLG